MTDIPAKAVEAAARALCIVSVAEPSGRRLCADHREWLDDRDLCARCVTLARAALTAAAPHIAAQATADLRARIEALRDEWRVVADDRCGCVICTATRRHLDALDALLRERAR